MQSVGGYSLTLTIGNTIVPIQSQMIQELTISQDMDQLLPTFKMIIREPTGVLGEIVPLDKDANAIGLKITGMLGEDYSNEFKFLVKRRKAASSKEYAVEGVLNVRGLLDPMWTRALTGDVRNNLTDIVTDELDISNVKIGASLQFDKTIIQPGWSNAQLFRYLRANLIGVNQQAGYYCCIVNISGEPVFIFKSINELVAQDSIFNFMIGYKQFEDYRPVSEYHVIDSSQLIGDFGAKTQNYNYFDYDTGSYKNNSVAITDYPSLAEQFLVDNDSVVEGAHIVEGRYNDFGGNFEGKVRNSYYNRLTGLINMWISTWGTENIVPGDIVKVVFNEAFASGDFFLYQHSGYWLVKRVVHVLTSSFMTNILLTRNGIDTSIENTLLEAQYQKR